MEQRPHSSFGLYRALELTADSSCVSPSPRVGDSRLCTFFAFQFTYLLMGKEGELKFGERRWRQLWEALGTWEVGGWGRNRTTLEIDQFPLCYTYIFYYFIFKLLNIF